MSATESPEVDAELVITSDGPVRVVTVNRPEYHNAVTSSLHSRLATVWREISGDDDARAIVLTGSGGAFSSGAQLDWLVEFSVDDALRRRSLTEAREIVEGMVTCPLPIVAAVNGPAVGFGFSLAVLCDFVFMADDAFLADPHTALGLVAADGAAVVLPLMTGMMQAKELIFLGERIYAEKAVEIGLAHRMVPRADLMVEALSFAHRLADVPPRALQDTKRALQMHFASSMRAILDFGLAAQSETFLASDHRTAVEKLRARIARPKPA